MWEIVLPVVGHNFLRQLRLRSPLVLAVFLVLAASFSGALGGAAAG